MQIGRALTWTAERFPERTGVVAGPRRLTYREWDARTNRIAHALLASGVRPGDRVATFLSNSEVMASTHLAAQKLGVMSTPLNIRLSPSELAFCLEDAAPTVVVTDDASADVAARALETADVQPVLLDAGDRALPGAEDFESLVAAQPDSPTGVRVEFSDPSVMLYTSGTTGKPKGVPRTQHNEFAASAAHVIQARYASGEVTLGAMPMYHTMGLRSLLSMVLVGGTFVELPAFDARRALDLIESEKVTCLYLVPTAFWALSQTGELGRRGASVRKLGFAGAPMTSTLTEQLTAELHPDVFINHYGSSEVYTFAIAEDAAVKPGSAGRAGVFSLLRVVGVEPDAGHDPLPVGEVGEIVASLESDEAFAGYWNRPDADARGLREGWYHTGDLGEVDADGDLWVIGRVDDMIISGGENVHPVEVEDVLARSADVAEVAVVGLPDEKWGQAVTAFVVPVATEEDPFVVGERIQAWARDEAGLSPYKRPKHVVIVREIPKSPVGKILRRRLVAGEYEAASSPGTTTQQS
jgi:2-furoate---CoA ligase